MAAEVDRELLSGWTTFRPGPGRKTDSAPAAEGPHPTLGTHREAGRSAGSDQADGCPWNRRTQGRRQCRWATRAAHRNSIVAHILPGRGEGAPRSPGQGKAAENSGYGRAPE